MCSSSSFFLFLMGAVVVPGCGGGAAGASLGGRCLSPQPAYPARKLVPWTRKRPPWWMTSNPPSLVQGEGHSLLVQVHGFPKDFI